MNYLRKKIDFADEPKLIHTVRGAGYRIGRPAPSPVEGTASELSSDAAHTEFNHNELSALTSVADGAGVQQTPMRALIHSVAHDLAQPLTSIRCFLEVMGMHQDGPRTLPADLKMIEQQADRAISLAKGISALVREIPVPSGPWTSLDALLNDLLNDFIVLLHSGLLTVDRQWDSSIHVTSSPVLRHLMVLFLSKLVGRNTRPLVLTISAQANEGRCLLEMKWKPADDSRCRYWTQEKLSPKNSPPYRNWFIPLAVKCLSPMVRPKFCLHSPRQRKPADRTLCINRQWNFAPGLLSHYGHHYAF